VSSTGGSRPIVWFIRNTTALTPTGAYVVGTRFDASEELASPAYFGTKPGDEIRRELSAGLYFSFRQGYDLPAFNTIDEKLREAMAIIVHEHPGQTHPVPGDLDEWAKHVRLAVNGYGAYFVSFFEPYRRDSAHRWELGPRDELRLVMEKPRLFPPGQGWAYHGSNYIVLRLVVEEATGVSLRDALRQRVLAPLGLAKTDLVEGPVRGDCARGYFPADNPVLPGGSGPVDVTEIDVPFHRAGGGVVSTAGEIAKMLRALLGGEFLPDHLRAEMLQAVDSDWPETDRYGLGIGEITALMGRQRSPCGPAWGHIGFSVGYTAVALSSEDGKRQVVICANGSAGSQEAEDSFWDTAGRLAWHLYCL